MGKNNDTQLLDQNNAKEKTLNALKMGRDRTSIIVENHLSMKNKEATMLTLLFDWFSRFKANTAWLSRFFYIDNGLVHRNWLDSIEKQKPQEADFPSSAEYEEAVFLNAIGLGQTPRTNIVYLMLVVQNESTEVTEASTFQNIVERLKSFYGVRTVIGCDAHRMPRENSLYISDAMFNVLNAKEGVALSAIQKTAAYGNYMRQLEMDLKNVVANPTEFDTF